VPFVSAILLAAGESSRMGRQKGLLPWEGTPLIAYQLDQLSSIDDIKQIIVVTGHEPDRIAEIAAAYPRAQVAHNAAYQIGKVSSIKAGLAALSPDADAILLLSVDQPRPVAILRAVVDAHTRRTGGITAPARKGRRGHPIVFDASLRDELQAISEETQGIRAVVQRHAADVREVEVSDPAIHLDLNRPEDLERGR
jgi:molybdenum cofactor cytidylyltransferase